MADKPYSFTGFARLQPNQASVLGLQPGANAELVTVEGPGGAKFTVAKKIAGQFQRFVNDLGGRGYQIDPKQSGGYANRNIRGSNNLSQHAYGNAIDLNWNANPLGSSKHNLPPDVGDIASKYGLAWGGTFSRPDPMHFEASRHIPDMAYEAGPAANGTNMPARRPTLSESMGAGFMPGMAPPGTAPSGGPAPMPVEALSAPSGRYSRLADALLASGVEAKPKGWGDLLNAAGDLTLGYSLSNKEEDAQKAYSSKLAERLGGASSPEALSQTLIASGDPDLVKQGVTARLAQAKPKSEIGRFRPTKQGVVDTTTGQIVPGTEQMGADQAEYGTSPQYYRDKDGKLKIGQLSKAGGMKAVELPADATEILPGIDYKDTGTAFVGFDKRTGEAVQTIPKQVAEEAALKKQGEAAGQATVSLPAAKTTVESAFRTIGELEAHPGLDTGTGLSNILDPRSWTPGTDAYNFLAKNKKAISQSFMGAREALKGAGQVTDFEGAKGEQSLANLDAAQGKEQYLAELKELKRMMQASYDDLQKKAGLAGAHAAPSSVAPTDADAIRQQRKQKYGLED